MKPELVRLMDKKLFMCNHFIYLPILNCCLFSTTFVSFHFFRIWFIPVFAHSRWPLLVGRWLLIQLQCWPAAVCHTFKVYKHNGTSQSVRCSRSSEHWGSALSFFPSAWAWMKSLSPSVSPTFSLSLSLRSPTTPTVLSYLINEGPEASSIILIHSDLECIQVCHFPG